MRPWGSGTHEPAGVVRLLVHEFCFSLPVPPPAPARVSVPCSSPPGTRSRSQPYPVLSFSCGVVWCGVVWCGVVWCGVVWCGVVWCCAVTPQVVNLLRSADVAVLFNSAKQCHTLNSKFLEDLESRLSTAVAMTAASVQAHLGGVLADGGDSVAALSGALLNSPAAALGTRRASGVASPTGAGGGETGREWVVEGPGFVNVGDLLEQYASLWLIYTQYATSFAGDAYASTSHPRVVGTCGANVGLQLWHERIPSCPWPCYVGGGGVGLG